MADANSQRDAEPVVAAPGSAPNAASIAASIAGSAAGSGAVSIAGSAAGADAASIAASIAGADAGSAAGADAGADARSGAGADPARRTVDFHFNVDHCINYACRVVRKARAAGKTVLVFSRDAERRARIDMALWTFSALDFLPHVTLPSPRAAQTPVWIAAEPPRAPRDLLLLLDDEPAPDFARWFAGFERIIDVVSADTGDRALARKRFKAYRDAGLAPVAHEVGAA